MYKSTFLSHLARAGRQHPFFSQNVNSANSTALSLVKPKLGLATERAYFSSWGGNGGYNGSSTSQTALIAVSTDDNQPWEKELGVHRKQFRSIAGIRRYSTGTQTTEQPSVEAGSLQLTGSAIHNDESSAAIHNGESSAIAPDAAESEHASERQDRLAASDDPASTASTQEVANFEAHLGSLYESQSFADLYDTFAARVAAGTTLTTASFNIFFQAVSKADSLDKLPHPGLASHQTPINVLFEYYGVMLERKVRPNVTTYEVLLEFLSRLRSHRWDQERVLIVMSFLKHTRQEAFLQLNREKLAELGELIPTEAALQLFRASIEHRDIPYKLATLEDLIVACIQDGRVDDAVTVFDYIQRAGHTLSYVAIKNLLKVCAKAKDMSCAVECFDTWKKHCLTMPPHDFWGVYHHMLRCYFATGDAAGALEFFQAARQQTATATGLRSFCVVVCGQASLGHFQEAHSFAKIHLANSDAHYSYAMGWLINEACLRGDRDVARKHFQEVTSLKSFASVPFVAWNYLAALTIDGQLDEVKTYVRDCVRQQIPLRIAHLSLLISKYLDAGRLTDALETCRYVGDRRAVYETGELNKRKLGLFNEIFMTDLLQRNLIDGDSVTSVADTVYLLARATSEESLLDFIEAILKGSFTQNLRNDFSLVQTLCKIAVIVKEVSQVHQVHPDLESTSHLEPRRREVYASLLDVLKSFDSGSSSQLMASEALESFKAIARSSGFSQEVDDLPRSSFLNPTRSSGQKLLPNSKAVFRPDSDPVIDRHLTAQIGRLLRALDSSSTQTLDAREDSPETQIVQLLRSGSDGSPDRVLGVEVIMLLLIQAGRCNNVRLLDETLKLSEMMLPRMVISSDYLPAGIALLQDAAIVAYNDSRNPEAAEKCHERILEVGYVPSANAYASFIAKMDEDTHRDGASRALALFYEARSIGVQPTEYLYNTVIAKLAKARRNDDALALFQEMKQVGLLPNDITYGTIINSCCRVGLTEKAEVLLEELESLPRSQNRIAPYNTLIQYFIQTKKDRKKAFFYWDKLIARAIPPTAHSFRLLIEAHGHLSPVDPEAAMSVIGLMKANGVRVTSVHHAAIIHMYGIVLNDLEAAMRYFNHLVSSASSRRVALDHVLYQSIIESTVKAGEINGLKTLLSQMDTKGIPLNAYIVNFAIEGYSKAGELQEARKLFDRLPSSGAGPRGKEPSTYETMIKAYNAASQSEQSLEILNLLQTQGYPHAIVSRVSALVPQPADPPEQTGEITSNTI